MDQTEKRAREIVISRVVSERTTNIFKALRPCKVNLAYVVRVQETCFFPFNRAAMHRNDVFHYFRLFLTCLQQRMMQHCILTSLAKWSKTMETSKFWQVHTAVHILSWGDTARFLSLVIFCIVSAFRMC